MLFNDGTYANPAGRLPMTWIKTLNQVHSIKPHLIDLLKCGNYDAMFWELKILWTSKMQNYQKIIFLFVSKMLPFQQYLVSSNYELQYGWQNI